MSVHFDQVKSSIDRFCVAWNSHDGATLAGFFVTDGSLINPFGERADGRDAVGAMYSEYFGGMLRDTSTTFNLASVRDIEQDHAFADGEQTINAADGSVLLVVHVASLMRRESGEWHFVDSRPYAFAPRQ
jgi:uncharacterized protein (TIGR02246 family)